ncbi:MAG: LuxR C-terminal-related transcriptional regulator [Chloroflexota bacterium]
MNIGSNIYSTDRRTPLCPHEVEVLRLFATEASNRAIAAELVVSIPTAKTHVSHILGKLNVQSRVWTAATARELHLI